LEREGTEDDYVYSWVPSHDVEWTWEQRFQEPRELPSPPGKCFAVIVSPNKSKDKYDGVDFWLENWCWIKSDPHHPDRPIDWGSRYDRMLK
ncbi:MAG: hypothetical protein ABL994_20295, partial [Verrucomicrobiales bacterium]